MTEKLYKVGELAKMQGCTTQRFYQAIDKGRLVATLVDGKHYISWDDYAKYLASLWGRNRKSPRFYSVKEAAKVLEMTPQNIYSLIDRQVLPARKKVGKHMLSKEIVHEFKKQREEKKK